jgi:hypothetical protein
VSAPLGVTPLWASVVRRAGARCQCRGACGNRHYKIKRGAPALPTSDPRTRCEATLSPAIEGADKGRLYVAPRDPDVPERDAWRVPAAELAAWCGPCLSGAHSPAGVRARAAAARQAEAPAKGAQAPASARSVASATPAAADPVELGLFAVESYRVEPQPRGRATARRGGLS